ncbi:MAG: hypothetical protein JNK05_00750 [Myxococcales bacterium]|nr:hypothetical protein [Myxococcales bacterium]
MRFEPTSLEKSPSSRVARSAVVSLIAVALAQCGPARDPGCLGSTSLQCVPPPACRAVRFACSGNGPARVSRITTRTQRPAGLDALASVGDWVLANDNVTIVIDDVSPALALNATTAQRVAHNRETHTHHLAPSGGTIIDVSPSGGTDHLNQIYQITGIVPRDALHYTAIESRQEDDTAVVIARGFLDVSTGGDGRVLVTTRYELRPCDPGVRVRTELYNGGRVAWSSYLSDAWFLGDRSQTPFVQGRGLGFEHPELQLTNLDASLVRTPYMAASSHAGEDTSYATFSCTEPLLDGVVDPTIVAMGLPRSYVAPGDGLVFERMIVASRGAGLGALEHVMAARRQLFGEPIVSVRGTIELPRGLGDERAASAVFYEPAPDGSNSPREITVWSEAVPDATGAFRVSLPAGRRYHMQWWRLGRPFGEPVSFETPTMDGATVQLPPHRPPPLGAIRASVTITGEGVRGQDAELVLVPVDPATASSVRGSVYGFFDSERCAPYLGPTHGGSPGCNRVLVRQGSTVEFFAPNGTYWVYAHGGPSRTIARTMVTVTEGATQTVSLSLSQLSVFPTQSMTADFHVHSGRSFDTSFPELDRVLSFLVNDVDVIAATDHDVTTSYASALVALGATQRVFVQPGVEMTPLIPSQRIPGASLPRTVGHFNAWPIPFDDSLPRNGAPWDELAQPGELFDLLRPIVDRGVGVMRERTGVIQLNHPYAGSKIGRDEGYFRTIRWNPTQPVPREFEASNPASLLVYRPGGADGNRNVDFDTIETMQGNELLENLRHRQGWHGLLNAGHLRAGTADSDTHSLAVEPMGFPRNIVLGAHRSRYNFTTFNALVREGSMVGTNGPFIDAQLAPTGAFESAVGPSVRTPVAITPNARLRIAVRAAPWIPVEEVRIVVNGRIVRSITEGISRPQDPFGTAGIDRYTGEFSLAELGVDADAWIIVEAGLRLPTVVDSDNDGLLDRADFNGDGVAAEEHPPAPRAEDPRFHSNVIVPGMWAWGFTNPFVVDANGGSWEAPNR